MMKSYTLLMLFIVGFSVKSFSSDNDSLNPFTDKELLKLSNYIYELEKRDSIASANEPNGFQLKDRTTISDLKLLIDLDNDSITYYTGIEMIKLSNYIFELEKRDSIRKANDSIRALRLAEMKKAADTVKKVEFHLDEEKDIRNFESVLFFSFNSSSLTPESFKALEEIVKILKTYLNVTFVIEGYTDNAGSPSYNKVLSIRRAKAVKEFFIAKGIAENRIISVSGYGGSKYLYNNDTEENRAKNRNVVIRAYH